jgi:RND family efflux transporter MFP subunit
MTRRLALAAVALVPLLQGCVSDAAATTADPAKPLPVTVTDVETYRGVAPVRVAGVLTAKEEIPLSFTIGGVLASMTAESGDRVRAGQVLAALSGDEIESAVRKAREARSKAERDLTRAKALYADSAATKAQLDDATTGLEVAAADLRAAEFNRRYATITAPADGIVLRRAGEPGQLVRPGEPVVVLRTLRRGLIVRAGVADRDVVSLHVGDAAEVRLDAYPGKTWRGTVRVVGAAPEPMTGAYPVEISLAEADVSLASGLVAQVAIAPRPRRGVAEQYAVPADAIVEADGDSAAVFVLAPDGTARRRVVRLAGLNDTQVLVGSGLRTGEKVVVAGGAFITDGARVRVVGAGAEP